MASTIDTQNTQRYVDFDEYIEYQLQKTRGNIKTTDILTAFAFIAVFVLAYLLLFVICDHWLLAEGFGPTARVVLISLVGFVSAGWLTWKVLWPYLRQVNRLFAAKVIERSQPELRSTLLNLIDARSAGQNVSPQILSAMEKRAAISMSHTNVDEAVDRRPLMRACYGVLALVVLFCLYTLFTPKKVSTSLWRALNPTAAVAAPTQTEIDNVTPGDVEVIPGTRVEVLADIKGDIPKKVILRYSTTDQEFVEEPLEMRPVPEKARRYRAEIIGANGEGIQQDLSYYITAGDARSRAYEVQLYQPPSAEIVELQYNYPDYMDRESKTRQSGNIDDYEGVSVTFIAEGNTPLKSATITFHDDQGTDFRAESLPMSAINSERTRFRANWVLSIPAENGIYPRYYTIECKNERGESDPNPSRWPIRIHPDQRPEVRILNPREAELERPANAILPLTAAARDDFKVQSLTLWKQLNDEPPEKHTTLFRGEESSLSVDSDWRIGEGWELKIGDRISYWVEAEDNRTPKPGKRNSDKYTILIQPEQSEEEVQEQLEADRRPQEEQQQKSDRPEQNPDEAQEKPQDRPQEDPNQDADDQPMPQEGEPEQTEEGQEGDEGQEGQEGDSSGDESSQQEEGQGDSEQSREGGQSVKKDGTEDGKALERLHKHVNRNETEPNPDSDSQDQPEDNNPSEQQDGDDPSTSEPQNENDQNPEQPADDSEKTSDPDADNKTGQEPSSEDPNQPMTGEDSQEGEPEKANDNRSEDAADKTDRPAENENSEAPSDSQEKTDEGGEAEKRDASEDPMSEQDQKKDSDPMQPEDRQAEGGSEDNASEGQPGTSSQPSESDNDKTSGEQDAQARDDEAGRQADKPLEGDEKPADPDDSAQKRDATGEEKGPATAEDDPNADPKQAKELLDRTDPDKPAAKQDREGDPKQDPDSEAPDKANDDEDRQPAGSKPGSEAPDMTDPDKNADGPHPDQTPQTDDDPQTDDRKPATPQDQPESADEEPQGPGRPEGQQAEKPESGEEGSSENNQEGTPGSEDKGPGERTPEPGDTEQARKPENGRPDEEAGEGSRSHPSEQTEEVPKAEDRPQEPGGQEAPNTQKPAEGSGQPGDPGTDAEPQNQDAPQDATGDAGTAADGKSQPSQGQPPSTSAADDAEKANLEHGRKAADLALKRLEDQIRRGEVNEEWLKEMGWDEADASQFLDRMKNRMNRPSDDSPESHAQQRQFNEWLKRLNNPNTKTERRSGSSVRKRSARDLFDAKNSTPPPELREFYEEYRRGISERSR